MKKLKKNKKKYNINSSSSSSLIMIYNIELDYKKRVVWNVNLRNKTIRLTNGCKCMNVINTNKIFHGLFYNNK